MRTLSNALTTAQKSLEDVLVKLVLTSGSSVYSYTLSSANPLYAVLHHEEAYSQTLKAIIVNDDAGVQTNLHGFKTVVSWGYDTGASRTAWAATTAYAVGDIVVPVTANGYQYICTTAGTSGGTEPTWGTTLGGTTADGAGALVWTMDGNSGDEYSASAPLVVRTQNFYSAPGILYSILHCFGLSDQLDMDEASEDYNPLDTNVYTVKDFMVRIASGTLGAETDTGINGNEALDASETAFDVTPDATTAIPVGTIIQYDKELMNVTGTGTTLTVTRGYGQTTAATHLTGLDIFKIVNRPYSHCTSYTIDWDSEDSLIDTFMPKRMFRILEGQTRLAKLKELLNYTKCVMRIGDDGDIHVLQPTVSGSVYAYTYENTLSTDHNFVVKQLTQHLVLWNKVTVKSPPSDDDQYSGSATDSGSNTLLPKEHFRRLKVASDAEAAAIAEAMIQQLQIASETVLVVAPVNCGQEVHDYIIAVDPWDNLNPVGNVSSIDREYKPGKLEMSLGVGRPVLGSSIMDIPIFKNLQIALKEEERIAERNKELKRMETLELSPLIKSREFGFEIVLDNGDSVIATGVKGYTRMTFEGWILRATLVAKQSGSIVIDIWKDTYANFPPTDADSITASAPPTLSSAQKSDDDTLTGWTRKFTYGDVLGFNVDSCVTITQVTLILTVVRT